LEEKKREGERGREREREREKGQQHETDPFPPLSASFCPRRRSD
jgi:hypothetical protein